MAEEKETKKEDKKISKIELVEVPTQFGIAYQLPDGTKCNEIEYLVWLGNQILEIRKAL